MCLRHSASCAIFVCLPWSTSSRIHRWIARISLSIWSWPFCLDLWHDMCSSLWHFCIFSAAFADLLMVKKNCDSVSLSIALAWLWLALVETCLPVGEAIIQQTSSVHVRNPFTKIQFASETSKSHSAHVRPQCDWGPSCRCPSTWSCGTVRNHCENTTCTFSRTWDGSP